MTHMPDGCADDVAGARAVVADARRHGFPSGVRVGHSQQGSHAAMRHAGEFHRIDRRECLSFPVAF